MSTKTKPSQTEQVLTYLIEQGTITPLRALYDLGIMRLSARIMELRALGYVISTDLIVVRTRAGKTRTAQYTLRGDHESV